MNLHTPDHHSLATALEGSPVTIFFQNTDGQFVWLENAQSIWRHPDRAELSDNDLFTASSAVAFRQAKSTAAVRNSPETVELHVNNDITSDGKDCFLKVTVRPAFDRDDKLAGFLGSSVDVTLEKQREQTLRTLLMEVAHRSKNMLAMVLSLAAQTGRSSRSVDEFLRAFSGRVQSLAKSQDAVTEADWSGARFSELVRLQVTDVVPLGAGRVALSGDDPTLSPTAAVHVGLALHELVTNSLVFGALLDPKGVISIACTITSEPGRAPVVVIEWNERPGVQEDRRDGKGWFGKMLLERAVPAAVNGEAFLSLTGESVRYRLTVGSTEYR